MNVRTRNALLAILFATAPLPILVSALAQDDATDTDAPRMSEGMNGMMGMDGMNGMTNGSMMDGGTMPKMGMMRQCADLMEGMHPNGAMPGRIGHHMGAGTETNGGTSHPETASYDVATAEALARAYLRGQNSEDAQDLEILGATLDAGRYTVTYQLGDTEGVVVVDAATGAVMPEDTR